MNRLRTALVVGFALLVACDLDRLGPSRDRDQRGRARQVVVVGRPSDAISLDPARPTDNESAEVLEQVFEPLVRYHPGTTNVEPALATSWETDDSGLVWTFHLREGVRFHDGSSLTADAVVFSFERQRDPAHPYHTGRFNYWENNFRNILKVEKVDALTVRFRIASRYAPFLANMTMFPVSIVSPGAVEKWGEAFAEHPVGTGPFVVERWDRGERIVLGRWKQYWGPAASIERLVFEVVPDARQRLIDLESGAIDLAVAILPEELQFVDLHPGLTLYRPPTNNVTYLAMNCLKPPFDDVRVRRAVNLAINKQPIVRLSYQGLAIPAESPLPPTQWGHVATAGASRYAPNEARALLAEAAADNVKLDGTYTLFVPSTPRPYLPNPESVSRVIQTNLSAIGLKTQIVMQPFEAHNADTEHGRHDLALAGWVGDNGDPDNYLYLLFDKDNTVPGLARNIAFYRSDTVSELLRRAQAVEDRTAREALYAEVQRQLVTDAPWVPLAHSQVAIAASDGFDGIVVNAAGHVVYTGLVRVNR
ncbi:MAG TPA: ABC transporter substrate-binding protein [Kofleriaceae bacterium]|nr:ABC transporter substrate-binding protein [Kofleriaceae bacterium]